MANVFSVGPTGAEFQVDVTGDVVTLKVDGNPILAEQQAAIVDAAAATATAMTAGGTGDAAGAWDTAGHRDESIAAFAALLVDVEDLRVQVNLILAALRAHGLIAT